MIILILTLFFIPIGLCEKFEDIKELNNIKIYNENNKTIDIYDKNESKLMNIKLISTSSNIDKFIKIVEITNYIEYMPKEKEDFITKTKKIYGRNDVYKIEYFIEKYNYTFENIIINKSVFNNKTGKNESKLINKSIVKDIKSFWVKFEPYNKKILKNEKFKLKIIHYKKPELGFFKIQTIPIFKNIECKEFTWWNGNWNLKRPILINNTYGDNVTDYQLKSVNLSQYEINASSTRIINETSGLQENFWNESIDSNGNLEFVWCNFSEIINNTWVNETYYIYYQSIPNVNSVSNGDTTFKFFDDFIGTSLNTTKWDIVGTPTTIFINDSIMYFFHTDSLTPAYIKSKNQLFLESNIMEMKQKDITSNYYCLDYGFGIGSTNNILKSSYTTQQWGLISYKNGNQEISGGIIHNDIFHKIKLIWLNGSSKIYEDDILKYTHTIYIPIVDLNLSIGNTKVRGISGRNMYGYINYIFVREYTNNEPELWTVGNIEYPGAIDMNCSLKIITHLTNKDIKIVDMNGSIIKENSTNECINLSYDSYMIYMSNPVKISSFTELLNTIDNVFIQFFLFAFLIVIGIIFFTFLQIIKNRGFKGVTK